MATTDAPPAEEAPEEGRRPDVVDPDRWERLGVILPGGPDGEGLSGAEVRAALAYLWKPTPPSMVSLLPRYSGSRNTPKSERNRGKCDDCGAWHELPAVHLDYCGHSDTTRLVAEVDPWWKWEPRAGWDDWGEPLFIRDANGYPIRLWIDLSLLGVTRPGVGTVERGKQDPEKELIGDAIRNAAMRFGVAADLWSKAAGADAVDDDQAGQTDQARYARHAAQEDPEKAARRRVEEAWDEEALIEGRKGAELWNEAAKAYGDAAKALAPERREVVKARKAEWEIGWPMTPAQARRMMALITEQAAEQQAEADKATPPGEEKDPEPGAGEEEAAGEPQELELTEEQAAELERALAAGELCPGCWLTVAESDSVVTDDRGTWHADCAPM